MDEICKTCENWLEQDNLIGFCGILAVEVKKGFSCASWDEKEEEITEFYCSFCGKEKKDVNKMVGVAGSYICDVCVENCRKEMIL